MKFIRAFLASALASSFFLAACSSSPTREQLAQDQIRAEELRAKADARQTAARQSSAEKQLDAVPAWALQAPPADGTGVYAVGMGQSSDYRTALRKATLDAEFGLAKMYGQEISGSERSFVQDQGAQSRSVTDKYTALIDKLVSQVPVVGFESVHQEIKPIDGVFHAYVALKLPYDEFNRVVQQQRSLATDSSVVAAFNDLERRVSARQEQRRKDALLSAPVAQKSTDASASGLSGTPVGGAVVGAVASPGVISTPAAAREN